MASPAFDSNGSFLATSQFQTTSSGNTGQISTSQSPDTIVLIVLQGYQAVNTLPTVTSIAANTGGTLTWTKRNAAHNAAGGTFSVAYEVWTAPAPTTLTNFSVTVHFSSAIDGAVTVMFALHGLYSTSSPFDSNAGLPAVQNTTSNVSPATAVTYSTTQADDFLIYLIGTGNGSQSALTAAGGWTELVQVRNPNGATDWAFIAVSYKSVSAPQTAATATPDSWSGSAFWIAQVDAFTADSPSTTIPYEAPKKPWQLKKRRKSWPPRKKALNASPTTVKTGAGAATGVATVAATGVGKFAAVGDATGLATVAAVGNAPHQAVGTIAGIGSVIGSPFVIDLVVGDAAGLAHVAAVGVAVDFASGAIAGVATVAGHTLGVTSAIGTVTGHATVTGASITGGDAQATFVYREALRMAPAITEATSTLREVLKSTVAVAQSAFTYREVLRSTTPPPVETALVYREVIYGDPNIASANIEGFATVEAFAGGVSISSAQVEGVATVRGAALSADLYVIEFPPGGPVTVGKTVPSYLYWEYNDDDALQAMVATYNAYTEAYINWFNSINLPIYTEDQIAGPLLDWVATNLYGFPRPGLPFAGTVSEGPYNTFMFNALPFNGWTIGTSSGDLPTTDDIYKRCLTWLYYKGDGFQFTIPWLKRRVQRWLSGVNGVAPEIDETYSVSVQFTGLRKATINIPPSSVATTFQAAVNAGVLTLPFNIAWTVTIS